MTRPQGMVIRVLNYNILWDAIFPDDDPNNHIWRDVDKSEAFRRILRAIRPDIACLQEINPMRDPADVGAIFDEELPLADGRLWQVVKSGDNYIVARFNLQQNGFALRVNFEVSARVDLPDTIFGDADLYMVCAHFKSGGGQANIDERQRQADLVMSQVREFRTAGGRIKLPFGTPYLLLGDFNVYDTDPHYHLTTLLSGDIVNEDQFGVDVLPDWDDSSLADALPTHNGAGQLDYTWRSDGSGFAPYALDRILYSDSVMLIVNKFILNTTLLSAQELSAFGLSADDVVIKLASGYYDHFPMVVDFVILAEE